MKNRPFKRRKVAKWLDEYTSNSFPEIDFYKKKDATLSAIPDSEREFMWCWCRTRHLDDVYAVVTLTFWVRTRSHVAVFFILDSHHKNTYMVLCIHLALKWLGYDEDHSCNFFKDLVDEKPELKPEHHRRMEMELLKALQWEM